MRWLGSHPYVAIPLGILITLVIFWVGLGLIRMLASGPAARGSPPPEDVEELDVRYRCPVCATEIRLTRLGGSADFSPPRHCGEQMTLVVEAEA